MMVGDKINYKDSLDSVACNLCGSDDYEIIFPSRYDNIRPNDIAQIFRSSGDEILLDQLVLCKQCGLKYLNPRLPQGLILEGYSNGTDETFVSQVQARERVFSKSLDFIERFISHRGQILDVGTAGGSFLDVAKQRGWEVAGCEPNHWLSEWGRKRYGIPIKAGTIFDMELEDTSFDVVTLWDVLEHAPDPKAVLNECNRILKPGGLLVVNYPDIDSLIARLMGRKWVFLLSVHLYYFTLETMRKMLQLSGFQVLKHKRHWQSLELGYVLMRMKPYIKWASQWGTILANTLHMQNVQFSYWMGQSLIVARKEDVTQGELKND